MDSSRKPLRKFLFPTFGREIAVRQKRTDEREEKAVVIDFCDEEKE